MANISEKGGWSSYDSYEAAAQKKKNDELKKKMMAKRGITPQEQPTKKQARIKSGDAVVIEDSMASIIDDLRERFLNQGKEMAGGAGGKSIRAMQQFMRRTDGILAKKNNAGGSLFTENNKEKLKQELGPVFDVVRNVRVLVNNIAYTLKTTKSFDLQHLDSLRIEIENLAEALPEAVNGILDHPYVKEKIANKVPFWIGGSEEYGGGHNNGFKDVLLQFKKDIMKGTYQEIANRIDEYIKKGKDPLSYVAESKKPKKAKITESVLAKMIKESIMRVINEGTSFPDTIEKWNTIKEQVGAEQMLDCIFEWSSSDQIDQWIEWFVDEEWVDFGGYGYDDDNEYVDDEEDY